MNVLDWDRQLYVCAACNIVWCIYDGSLDSLVGETWKL